MLKRIRVVGVTVALAAGLVGAVGPAASAATTTTIGYTCRSGADTTAIGVAVSATFPDRFATGRAFHPTDVATTVSIPREALTGIGDATSVTATTQLTVKVAQGGQSADAAWFGDAPGTTIPAGGDLKLTATGDVPTVTVHGSDPVSFTAAGLDVTLTPAGAAKGISLTCTPGAGQRTLLARLTTSGAGQPSASPTDSPTSATSSPRTSHNGTSVPVTPGLATPRTRSTTPPGTAPDTTVGTELDPTVFRACRDLVYGVNLIPRGTYVAGLANVVKQNAATEIGYPEPALLRSGADQGLYVTGLATVGDYDWACSKYTVSPDYHGRREFPVATSTSAAFGFVPVTAKAHLSQAGDTPVTAVAFELIGGAHGSTHLTSVFPWFVVATAAMSLRLSDVRVNGVPLDVGPNCRTSRPLYTPDRELDPDNKLAVMTGGTSRTATTPIFGNMIAGGGTAGDITVPPFTGCTTPNGDNLNKLLTASISGSGNYAKLTTGPLCPGFDVSGKCDAANQTPGTFATWTLTHGGSFTGHISDGGLKFILHPSSGDWNLTCTSADISGTAYNHSGATRGNSGTLMLTDIGGCTDNFGASWRIKENGPIGFSPVVAVQNKIRMRGEAQFSMTRTDTSGTCTITAANAIGMQYDNDSGTLSMMSAKVVQAGTEMLVNTSTCADFPANEIAGSNVHTTQAYFTGGDFVLPSDQAFTLTNP